MIEQLLAIATTKPSVIPNSPGPMTLALGDDKVGYFGKMTSGFIDRATLRSLTGLTAGTDTSYWDGSWVKLYLNKVVLYLPTRAPVSGINRNQLQTLSLVYGKTVTWGGFNFKVRLLKVSTEPEYGVTANFTNINYTAESANSEWAKLVGALVDPTINSYPPAWKLYPQASTFVPQGTWMLTQEYRRGDANTAIVASNQQVTFTNFTDTGVVWFPVLQLIP